MQNTTALKQHNIISIIKVLMQKQVATKQELAQLTGFTSVTAHNLINELVAEGICVETGQASSSGGRKAMVYHINNAYSYLPGVLLTRTSLIIDVHDLSLNRIYHHESPCDTHNPQETVKQIAAAVATALDICKIPSNKCLGLGVVVPGKINKDTGAIIYLPDIPGWEEFPLKTALGELTQMEIYTDNDINSRTLNAKWKGIFRTDTTCILLNITVGVGLGVLYDGNIFYGGHFFAGEIGHTTLLNAGPMCACGNQGCFEVVITDQAIISAVKNLESTNELFPANQELRISDVIQLGLGLSKKSAEVYTILRETAYYISILLDNIIKTYDPSIIILQNNWLKAFPDLYYYMMERLYANSPWLRRNEFAIILDDDDTYSDGAMACLVLEHLLTQTGVINNPFTQWMEKTIH